MFNSSIYFKQSYVMCGFLNFGIISSQIRHLLNIQLVEDTLPTTFHRVVMWAFIFVTFKELFKRYFMKYKIHSWQKLKYQSFKF